MKLTKEPDFFSKQVVQARRFYVEGAFRKSSEVKIICGGCEQTSSDFRIDRKDFPYYSIEFVAKGEGTTILAGHSFTLTPGTVFSYGPHISQIITTDPRHVMTKYFIDFIGNSAKHVLKKYVSTPGTVVLVSRPDEIARILDDIINHGLSGSRYKSMVCSILFQYLFYRIAETKVTTEAKLLGSFTTYQSCRQSIQDKFIELNSLKSIADYCRIDETYLCRLFKRFDTQSPYKYLMYLKMAAAAERLQQPGILIKEIAFELGFDDQYHFSRTFKKIFGISPQLFKNLRTNH